MPQVIPNTDTLKVAILAATFEVLQNTPQYTGSGKTPKKRVEAFINVYEILDALVTQNADEARAKLKAQSD